MGFCVHGTGTKNINSADTQYITDHWVQDGQYAVQVWTVHDIPVPETVDD